MARSRMKTVADSAEAEGVCFFIFLRKKMLTFPPLFCLLAAKKNLSSSFFLSLSPSYHRIYHPEVSVGEAQLHCERVPVRLNGQREKELEKERKGQSKKRKERESRSTRKK